MSVVDEAWIMVVALKLVVLVIFLLVIKRKVAPATLILIPLLYIGLGAFAYIEHAYSVLEFVAIEFVVGAIVWFVPGPLRSLMRKTTKPAE